ncbi:hypothetical protein GX865_02320 [Candidatus Saccharibacteria bacterium]|jgi:hypothetical protein|nr:hypothetical protein [Candidatus Saccharibacteria bacterium]
MKTTIYQSIRNIFKNRAATTGLVLLLLVSLVSAVLLAFKIQPSELQVSVHYTSFGGENVYRAQWYYLISFVAFGVIVATLHGAIFIKLNKLKGTGIALLFGYSTIAMLVIATSMLYRVITIAALT